MKELLATITKKKMLHLAYFENFTSGSGGTLIRDIDSALSVEAIAKLVQKATKKKERQGRIIFRYWVSRVEEMTDNREKYGHSNQTSQKVLSVSGRVYVRGIVINLAELIARKKSLSLTSVVERSTFPFLKWLMECFV